jgi:hypothetical protein
MDEVEELHAFTIGICEAICPWPPRFKGMPDITCVDLKKEYHYYMLGRAAGVCLWLILITIVLKCLL